MFPTFTKKKPTFLKEKITEKMLRKLIVGVFAVQASPLQKPCQDLFDKCVAEISELGQVSEGCEQMPWCDADGYFFQGKIVEILGTSFSKR